jgi:hypothetical protein
MRSNYCAIKGLIALHHVLLCRLYLFDALIIGIGILYIAIPIDILADSVGNLTFLIIFAIAAILYQIQTFRSSCGNAVFYCGLPFSTKLLFAAGLLMTGTPFVLAFSIAALAIAISGFGFYGPQIIFERSCSVFIVFILCKVLPLPLYILYRKHPALVPVLFLGLAGVQIALSMIREFFFSWIDNPAPLISCLFVAAVIVISYQIIIRARIS